MFYGKIYKVVIAIACAACLMGYDGYSAVEDRVYFEGTYHHDHWALQSYHLDDPKVVALVYYEDLEYAVYLNPPGRRGYHGLVRFIDNSDMESTLNRDYTARERAGLGMVLQLVADAYTRIVPIAQTSVLGNNAHVFRDGVTFMGHEGEPSFLHGHIIGRGNPDAEYVEGLELGGPIPGEVFDFRATKPSIPGNGAKLLWEEGQMELVVPRLREAIEQIRGDYEALGLRIVNSLGEELRGANKA